jgi:hypothetical protein|eukprot:COSAG01_NODE_13555_length_1568_cov_1.244384_1_plen_107_part_00
MVDGELPATRVGSVARQLAVPSAVLTTFVAALEIGGWSLSSVNLGAFSAAAAEAIAITSSQHDSRAMRFAGRLMSPCVVGKRSHLHPSPWWNQRMPPPSCCAMSPH